MNLNPKIPQCQKHQIILKDNEVCPLCRTDETEKRQFGLVDPKQNDYTVTGTTIEEERNGKTTIRQLESDIIEAAVAFADGDSANQEHIVGIQDAVDAYHEALRKQAREVK